MFTRRPHAARGMTVLEVTMAMAIIAIALLALLSAVLSSMTLVEANRQEAVAMNAARDKIAEMASRPFSSLFSAYRGHAFTVPGLGTETAGAVIFPVNAGNQLCETVSDAELGLPRDLNLNGTLDGDASSNYRLLPVKIRIAWETAQGRRLMDFNTILTSYK